VRILLTVVCMICVVAGCSKKVLKIDTIPEIKKEKAIVIKNDIQRPTVSPIYTVPDSMVTEATVHFALNSAELDPEAVSIIDKIDVSKVMYTDLTGYCCPIGTPEYNLELGKRRAEAVKDYLIKRGAASDAIWTRSMGEANLVSDVESEYWKNRRVEIGLAIKPKG
jgi:outer membrane protein OmpA-like peptidoglycan-associated protein